jgi:hypothetical protein
MTKRENKAWYYWWNPGDKKWYILAFVNGQGKGKRSCSLRGWEAKSGDVWNNPVIKAGHWQDEFAEYLHGTSFYLHLRSRPNLKKDCMGRLPEHVLSEIREQVTKLCISLSLTLLDP